MSRITGGVIHILRRKNLGNYEHHEAGVDLTFGVNEGEDHAPILDAVTQEAHARLETLLNGKVPASETPAPAKPSRRKEDKVAGPLGAPTNNPVMPEPATPPTSDSKTPSQAAPDPLAMEETTAVRQVPDQELSAACAARAKETHNGQGVRALIEQFAVPPGPSKNIPQDRRLEFLEELANVPTLSE